MELGFLLFLIFAAPGIIIAIRTKVIKARIFLIISSILAFIGILGFLFSMALAMWNSDLSTMAMSLLLFILGFGGVLFGVSLHLYSSYKKPGPGREEKIKIFRESWIVMSSFQSILIMTDLYINPVIIEASLNLYPLIRVLLSLTILITGIIYFKGLIQGNQTAGTLLLIIAVCSILLGIFWIAVNPASGSFFFLTATAAIVMIYNGIILLPVAGKFKAE